MKVLVTPRDRNPYQTDLYETMAAIDPRVEVAYLDGPTQSQTANLLALPALLATWRARGYRVLHLHWVYEFQLPWAHGHPWVTRLTRAWFGVFLATAKVLGYRIVWTAHNVLPHDAVFDDDTAARRELVRACDAVIAHSTHTAEVLERFGASAVEVVPQGADGAVRSRQPTRIAARAQLELRDEDVVVLFFGKVLPYKGVEMLLEAAAVLRPDTPIVVLVAGECRDPAYRQVLEALVDQAGPRVRANFEFVPDARLETLLAAADFAAFPFRTVTNSSSVVLALAAGVPVIVPELPELEDLPAGATVRHRRGTSALVETLERVAYMDPEDRAAMTAAATRFAPSRSWAAAATATRGVYARLLAGGPTSARRGQGSPRHRRELVSR